VHGVGSRRQGSELAVCRRGRLDGRPGSYSETLLAFYVVVPTKRPAKAGANNTHLRPGVHLPSSCPAHRFADAAELPHDLPHLWRASSADIAENQRSAHNVGIK